MKMPRFCTRTRSLSDEQNIQFAKDLKDFTQKEIKKFRSENQESKNGDEE